MEAALQSMLCLSLANVMNYRKWHRLLSLRQHLQSKGKKSSEARAQVTVRLKLSTVWKNYCTVNLAVLATVTRLHDGRDRQCFCHICVHFHGQMHIFGSNYKKYTHIVSNSFVICNKMCLHIWAIASKCSVLWMFKTCLYVSVCCNKITSTHINRKAAQWEDCGNVNLSISVLRPGDISTAVIEFSHSFSLPLFHNRSHYF